MRAWPIALAVAIGCGSKQPARSDCDAYAKRAAELMYIGFENGAHGMAQYIKAEYLEALTTPLAKYCREHLPEDHARCVAAAATAQDADKCLLDPAVQAPMKAFIRELVVTAAKTVAELPASAAECAAAADEALAQMRDSSPGAKLPSRERVAKLCETDRWTADFVRCTAAKGSGCRALPNVRQGMQKLLAE